MRKSALSFTNVEDECDSVPRNQFASLKHADLLLVRDSALRAGNVGDYDAVVSQLMVVAPAADLLREYIEFMSERKDFKRLAAFCATHYSSIAQCIKDDNEMQWHVQMSQALAKTIANKDADAYRQYKQLRSLLLYNGNQNGEEIKSKFSAADDLLNNTLGKSMPNNRQYERVDKTKTTTLPYVDVEVVVQTARGDSHLLLLTDDGYVLAYGDNSRGQLLSQSSVETLERAAYIPSPIAQFELVRAKTVFAREHMSAILTLDGRLLIFGEGWTDKCVAVADLVNYEFVIVMKNETFLLCNKNDDALIIDNSALKDYILSETASHKDEGNCYTTDIKSLEKHKIVKQIKKPKNEVFINIVCGTNHTLLLSSSGRLYGYGANDKHQLSHAKRVKIDQITELDSTKGEIIRAVFAFNDFSITIDETGACNISGRISRNS